MDYTYITPKRSPKYYTKPHMHPCPHTHQHGAGIGHIKSHDGLTLSGSIQHYHSNSHVILYLELIQYLHTYLHLQH